MPALLRSPQPGGHQWATTRVAPTAINGRLIHLWGLDYDVLLGQRFGVAAAARAVHHTTGKIVLVGDHSVGKSALVIA